MRATLFALILLVLPGSFAAGQVTPELSPGQRIWIRGVGLNNRLDAGVKGAVQTIRGDTLVLEPDGGKPTIMVRRDADSRIFVWAGGRTARGSGAFMGAGLGVMAGAITQVFKKADPLTDWMGLQELTAFFINGVAGGAVGLIAGGIVGGLISTDRWEEFRPGAVALHPILRPSPGGWTFGAKLSF